MARRTGVVNRSSIDGKRTMTALVPDNVHDEFDKIAAGYNVSKADLLRRVISHVASNPSVAAALMSEGVA